MLSLEGLCLTKVFILLLCELIRPQCDEASDHQVFIVSRWLVVGSVDLQSKLQVQEVSQSTTFSLVAPPRIYKFLIVNVSIIILHATR